MKFARTFSGTPGAHSVDLGGPDQLEVDLDLIAKQVDPLQSGGGIGEVNMQAGAATDAILGTRTVDYEVNVHGAKANTGVLTAFLIWITETLTAIIGADWKTTPPTSLSALNSNTYKKTETDALIDAHVGNPVPHVSPEDRAKWDNVVTIGATTGGTAGQVLTKQSSVDFDCAWAGGTSQWPSDNPDIFVSLVTGSDTTGTGSHSQPFKTVQYALSQIPKDLNGKNHYIFINPETTGVIEEDLRLVGYYNGAISLSKTDSTNYPITARVIVKGNSATIWLKDATVNPDFHVVNEDYVVTLLDNAGMVLFRNVDIKASVAGYSEGIDIWDCNYVILDDVNVYGAGPSAVNTFEYGVYTNSRVNLVAGSYYGSVSGHSFYAAEAAEVSLDETTHIGGPGQVYTADQATCTFRGGTRRADVGTGRTIYVDWVNGDDTTGDGSVGAPFKTLHNALDFFTWQGAGADFVLTVQVASGYNNPTEVLSWDLSFVRGKLLIYGAGPADKAIIGRLYMKNFNGVRFQMDNVICALGGATKAIEVEFCQGVVGFANVDTTVARSLAAFVFDTCYSGHLTTCQVSNCGGALLDAIASRVEIITLTGTGNTGSLIYATYGSWIQHNALTATTSGTKFAGNRSIIQKGDNALPILMDSAGTIQLDLGDANDAAVLKRGTLVASAVNYVKVTNAAAGSAPKVEMDGSDANQDLTVTGKGTGWLSSIRAKFSECIELANQAGAISYSLTAARLFARKIGGASMLMYITDLREKWLQEHLAQGNIMLWMPSTGAGAPDTLGNGFTVSATQSTPALAATTKYTATRRAVFTTTAVSGNAAGIAATDPIVYRGDVAGRGGFNAIIRFGFEAIHSAMQFRVGLSATLSLLAGEPNTIYNSITVAKATGGTNLQLYMADASTVGGVDLGVAPVVGDQYELVISSVPNGAGISVRITRTQADGTVTVIKDNVWYTTNLPASNVFLAPVAQIRTNATSAVGLSLMKMYVEAPY